MSFPYTDHWMTIYSLSVCTWKAVMCCYVCTAFLRKNTDWSINYFNFYYYRSFHIVSLSSAQEYCRKENKMLQMYDISQRSHSECLKIWNPENLDSYYVENGTTLCSTDFLMQQILERRCKMMPCRDARKYFLKWKNQTNHESPVSQLNLHMFCCYF